MEPILDALLLIKERQPVPIPSIQGTYWNNLRQYWGHLHPRKGVLWGTSRQQVMWAHHRCTDVNQHVSMLLAHLSAYPIRHAFPSLRTSSIGHLLDSCTLLCIHFIIYMMIHTNLWESGKSIKHRGPILDALTSHQGESTSTNSIHPGYLLEQSEAILGASASQEGCPWDTSMQQWMWAHHGCTEMSTNISQCCWLTWLPIQLGMLSHP